MHHKRERVSLAVHRNVNFDTGFSCICVVMHVSTLEHRQLCNRPALTMYVLLLAKAVRLLSATSMHLIR